MSDSFSDSRVVEISSPQKTITKPNLVLSILIFLLVFVTLGFGVGYFIGKAQSNAATQVSSEKSTSTTKDGQTTFTDPKEGYSIVFPDTWKLTEKVTSAPGVLLEHEKNTVELWLRIEQPYSLSQEQTDSISTTKKVKITVNGRDIEMTEHAYKTGGFFSVVILPATTETPLATFWIKAIDQDGYTAALEIVKSFKFS